MFDYIDTPSFPIGLVKTTSHFIVILLETDLGRRKMAVAAISVDAYLFFGFVRPDLSPWGYRNRGFLVTTTVLDEKSCFKLVELSFSSKLNWDSYIISIIKTASKKIGALVSSMKFLSAEVALYLPKSTIQTCMEYCCHVWAGAPSYYLELLINHKKGYVGLLVFHLLLLLNPSLIIKM